MEHLLIDFYKNYLENYYKLLTNFDRNKFSKLENILSKSIKNKKTIFIFGNGGSTSIASHVATDLTKMCKAKALNLSDHNLTTCFANDFGFENWVKESLKYYANERDLVILISSSGESKNMINAANYCRINKIKLITFTGFNKNNKVSKLGDLNFWVNSKKYNYVENIHQTWLLSIIDKLSKNMTFKKSRNTYL